MENEQSHESQKGIVLPKWIIVIALLVILLSVSATIYFTVNRIGYSNIDAEITVENWFSYLVSMMGVCITFIVGLQIYNSIELREKTKELSEQLDEAKKSIAQFDNYQKKFDSIIDNIDKNSSDLSNVFVAISEFFIQQKNGKIQAIVYRLHAINQLPFGTDLEDFKKSLNELYNLLPKSPTEVEGQITMNIKAHVYDLRRRVSIRFAQMRLLTKGDNEDKIKEEVLQLWTSCETYLQYIIDDNIITT